MNMLELRQANKHANAVTDMDSKLRSLEVFAAGTNGTMVDGMTVEFENVGQRTKFGLGDLTAAEFSMIVPLLRIILGERRSASRIALTKLGVDHG